MNDLEDRLRSWFTAEVDRARRDVAKSPVPGAPALRGGRSSVRSLAVVAGVLSLLLVAAILRPAGNWDPGKGPQRSSGPSPVTAGGVTFGADGLPIEIGGETVVRIPDLGSALGRSDSALVAGWYRFLAMRCPYAEPSPSPLLRSCNGDRLTSRPDAGMPDAIEIVRENVRIRLGAVAVRVHDNDPRAADCPTELRPRCEAAIVVDAVLWEKPDRMAGRFLDGIPGDIDGEPVIRPGDVNPSALRDDTAFLLGGWHYHETWFGCGRLGETNPLLDDCSPERISDTPWSVGPIVVQARDIPDGPVVVRVHMNDPRSARCRPAERIVCEERLVVDDVVWAGDDVTRTEPLGIQDVVMAISEDMPSFRVRVADTPRACDPGWPEISWVSTGITDVGSVLVFRTVEEREAVDENFGPTGWTGLGGCIVESDDAPSWTWVRVDNVMVATTEPLADRIREKLEAIAP